MDTQRPKRDFLPKPRRLAGSFSRWASTLPDESQEDILLVRVELRHRDGPHEEYRKVGEAGAKFQYPSTGLEYHIRVDPNEFVAEKIGRLAQEATMLVLNKRELEHEHTRVVISGEF